MSVITREYSGSEYCYRNVCKEYCYLVSTIICSLSGISWTIKNI